MTHNREQAKSEHAARLGLDRLGLDCRHRELDPWNKGSVVRSAAHILPAEYRRLVGEAWADIASYKERGHGSHLD
jgi:hypothetical protein